MSLALYIDEHVHRAITNGLRLRGVDVLTVQEDGRAGICDPLILDRATELERILFTQDDDFLVEANRRQQESIYFPGVIYAHQMWASIGDCIQDLELITQVGEVKDLANSICYLPL
ncbi:MAG: DUF5615 family PIN-like protein [Microcoleaceae cyanobacterium]